MYSCGDEKAKCNGIFWLVFFLWLVPQWVPRHFSDSHTAPVMSVISIYRDFLFYCGSSMGECVAFVGMKCSSRHIFALIDSTLCTPGMNI